MIAMNSMDAVDAASVVNQLVGRKGCSWGRGRSLREEGRRQGDRGKTRPGRRRPEIRFIDAKGKTVSQKAWLEMVVKPR